MMEPARLIDQTQSAFERALLEAGIQHSHDPLRSAKVLTALGVGTAAVVTTKSATAAMLTWKKAVASVAIAASGAGGVAAYTVLSSVDAPEPVVLGEASVTSQSRMAPGAAPVAEARVEEKAEEPASPEAVELMEEQVAPSPKRQRGKRIDRSELSAPAVPDVLAADIQAEVAFLDEARAALRAGAPSTTLQQLGEYRTKFPKGSLGLEAEVLRIEALAASGRSAEASRRASRLLERSPNSVVAARLRRYVQD